MQLAVEAVDSIAAADLEGRLSRFAPRTRPGSGDGCVVEVEVAPVDLKPALAAIASWGRSWSRGELQLRLGRRLYRLRTDPAYGLEWVDLGSSGAPDPLSDLL